MNFNNDYIMNQIQRFVVALSRLILMKDKSSEEEIKVEINKLTLESIGLDIIQVEELDVLEIIDILNKNALSFEENSQIIAELLNIRGDIYLRGDDTGNAYNCYLKSLEIYLYLNSEGVQELIIENKDMIDELENKLKEFVLPIDTEILIFNYRIKKGQYSKAEDVLFELLQMESRKRIIELGLNFYEELSKKDDAELISGNFSRDEVYQGKQELDRIGCSSLQE